MHTTLHVDGLASHEGARELTELFSAYGTVVYATVVTYPDLFHRHGGCGVVEMETAEGARKAIRALNDSDFGGHTLAVRVATAEEECAAGHPRMFESMNMRDAADEEPS